MVRIYRESFGFFVNALPMLLAFAALIEGLLWVLQPKSETGATFAALTILAYYFHRHFLFGETFGLRNQKPAAGAPPFKFGWFILISVGLVFVPIAVAFAIGFAMAGRFAPLLTIGISLPIYLLALSLFGTALPAVVARNGSYRLAQGLRAGFQTMWRLLLGPCLVGGVLVALAVLSGRWAAGLPDDSLVLLAYFTTARLLGFLPTILAVAVLCEMYRRTRPKPLKGGPGLEGHTPA
ncbi:MAG: hypothetical protein HC783_14205 [Rhodobacteraceae bacterium]|nr:hypothetical protein [Paracoccaceae bacterium]